MGNKCRPTKHLLTCNVYDNNDDLKEKQKVSDVARFEGTFFNEHVAKRYFKMNI